MKLTTILVTLTMIVFAHAATLQEWRRSGTIDADEAEVLLHQH